MITKKTAYDILSAYNQIESGEKMIEQAENKLIDIGMIDFLDEANIHGVLGLPRGDSSYHYFNIHPSLAIQVVKAHVASKRAELGVLNERAKDETK